MERYLCIHGHFYQPPRENPWLEAVEIQDSAYPYHDWNRRITAECYAPNAVSRILDGQGRIVRMVNNYSRISFNFGPTLLAWLEKHSADVYAAILEADRKSRERFSGHGSALAQAYSHMIMPLATRRDKVTQVIWGLRDFEHRFGRQAEGMWLPETAVDLETLDIMAAQGLRFALLAPHQARRVRPAGKSDWQDVSGGTVDPSMAYSLRLASGRSLTLFFYDGAISKAVAFERLLTSGESFIQRLIGGFSDKRAWPQLVHIATDGESYGHHHRFGDMALAYALHAIEERGLARLTNYGEFLEKHPPTHEAAIHENTSWSCAHGVERWQSGCGCSTGAQPGWQQDWRKPLRASLDWLRDAVGPPYEAHARPLFKDPWQARDDYIAVVLERSSSAVAGFLKSHAATEPDDTGTVRALKLLELQRQAMLMFTSCGWFFDELSGIETVQILQFAARVIQLGRELFGNDLEPGFLERLAPARSNLAKYAGGRDVYEKLAHPGVFDLPRVGAHYAISSLFEDYPEEARLCCYAAAREEYRRSESGSLRLVLGLTRLRSEITLESARLRFCVLYLGDHNLTCGVKEQREETDEADWAGQVQQAFERTDVTAALRLMDRHFGTAIYTLKSLFRDEQRQVLKLILQPALDGALGLYRRLYETHVPLMRFLKAAASPPPRALEAAAEIVLNADLEAALLRAAPDPEAVRNLLEKIRLQGVVLQTDRLEYAFRKNLERMAARLREEPRDLGRLQDLSKGLKILPALPFAVNLWQVQNLIYPLAGPPLADLRQEQGDRQTQKLLELYGGVARALSLGAPE